MAEKQFSAARTEHHPIERGEAFNRYLSPDRFKNPRDVQSRLIRFLREMPFCDLDEITTVHVEQVINRLRAKSYDDTYVRRLFTAFSGWMRWCHDESLLRRNPCRNITVRAVEHDHAVAHPLDLLEQFTAHVLKVGTKEDVVLWACLKGGMRINEPCRCLVEMVALDEVKRTPALMLPDWLTKNRRPRTVHLASWAYGSFADLRAAATSPKEFLLDFGSASNTDNARIAMARGRFYHLQTELWGQVQIQPKEMRSTIATMIGDEVKLGNALDLKAAAEHLGHSPEMFLKKYVKTPERRFAAVE